MQKVKPHQFRPPLEGATGPAGGVQRTGPRGGIEQGDSWEAYRKWLSRVDSVRTQRQQPDLSLYSWKGYQNWAARIRRDWNNES